MTATTTLLERWQKSRKRFWVYGEARMYLFARVSEDASIVFENGAFMIRRSDGNYLLNEDRIGLPVPREFELEQRPPKAERGARPSTTRKRKALR